LSGEGSERAAGRGAREEGFHSMAYLTAHWEGLLISAGSIIAAVIIALIAHRVIFWLLKRILPHPEHHVLEASLIRHGRGPAKWLFVMFALMAVISAVPIAHSAKVIVTHILGLGEIATVAWFAVLMTSVFEDIVMARYRTDVEDNLRARSVRTQVHVLRRIAFIVIAVIALAIMLMTIPQIREVGTSLLASAGVAGLVLGMAAKSTLGNLIAGFQIALTQPIRIDDVVIVDNQWGWIEEINTTYVVVRVWDLIRLVVPLTYFIEQPFQNWTRTTSDILEYVYIYTDYTVPVDALRDEFSRLLKSSPDWLGKVNVLQVTDADERGMQLRALADAPNSSQGWNLTCYVREGLIKFLQQQYPQCLPRTRVELGRARSLHKPADAAGVAGRA
jgi:small-conductance mechanosensitive channel